MFPVLFELPWGTSLNAYGTLILLGGLAAFPGVWWDAVRRGIRQPASFTVDVFLVVIVGAFVGGRLLHLITAPQTYAGQWWRAFSLDGTGFVFFGSLLAILAGWLWLARRYALPFSTLCDIGATWMPLGHAFGRLGCFAAGCCWGAPTDGVGGVRFPATSVVHAHEPGFRMGEQTLALHAVQLYETVGLLAIFVVLLAYRSHGRQLPWQQASRYALAYGLLRFTTEMFRGDDVRGHLLELRWPAFADALALPSDHVLLLSVGQAVAIVLAAMGASGLLHARRVHAPTKMSR